VEESIRMTEDRDKRRKYVHGVANPRIGDSLKNRTKGADVWGRQRSHVFRATQSRDGREDSLGAQTIRSSPSVGRSAAGRYNNQKPGKVSTQVKLRWRPGGAGYASVIT